jgi:GDPmannose 4,6-dehydratase
VEKAFAKIGMTIVWEGKGVDEIGREKETGIVRVRVSEKVCFFVVMICV